MSKQRIASNLLILGSGQLATWILSFFYFILISRYLGPGRLGELTLAVSVVSVVGLLIALGTTTSVTRTIARTPDRADVVVMAALLVRGMLAIPVPLILYIYAHAARLNGETRTVLYILAVWMILGTLSETLIAMFQGYERMSFVALGSIAQNVLNLTLAALVAWARGGLIALALVIVVEGIILLIMNVYWARQFVHLPVRVAWQDVYKIVVSSLAFWANSLFLNFYIYIDAVILGALAGPRAVGYYAPPTRIFTVALFLPSIIGAATFPLLSRLGIEAGDSFDRASRKTFSLLIVCSVPLTIGLATFAGPIVSIVFGPAFHPSVQVLAVLALCIPCTFLNYQSATTLIARDQQWRWTVIMAVSCVANPLVNLLFIPFATVHWHNGALGAAVALLTTEILMAVYGAVIVRDIVLHPALGRTVIGTLAGGAAQLAVIWLVGSHLLVLGEALGGLTCLAIAVTLGALPRNDVALLWSTLLRRSYRTAAR